MTAGAVSLHGPLFGHGFSPRKRALLRSFAGHEDLQFVARGGQIPAEATLLLWGSAPVPDGTLPGVRVVRVEDGFLRSVGLGADLVPPLSWVFDALGIYYDRHRPSTLEAILQDAEFSAEELARAAALRQSVVERGLTKYNLPSAPWQPQARGRPVVLVPGQVETDASIATGTVGVATNLGLLQAVRQARPDAWLVYKPHPDVVAGLRGAGPQGDRSRRLCDELLVAGSMHQILQRVDEVHVLTSLTGFEALLRGKTVVCWGQPFYAGWGLTEDQHPHPRRSRRLGLDELVAAALLRYPVYVDPRTGQRCTPEEALDALDDLRAGPSSHDAWWRRLIRPLLARP